MIRLGVLVALAVVGARPAAALDVPPLTGRVVDLADVLSPSAEASLTALLAAHEDSTTNQVVVLTIPSLGGDALEPYATRVFRAWGLGQADRDNGVLLLVSTGDRQLRIEVGRGLEGSLTDATSGTIIRQEIVPHFRNEDYEGGVLSGVDTILAVLDAAAEGRVYALTEAPDGGDVIASVILVGAFAGMVFLWTIVPLVRVGGEGVRGDIRAILVGLFWGSSLAVVLSDVGARPFSWWWIALLLVPAGLVGLNRWLEAHETVGPRRRHRRAKQRAFENARRRGARHVVVDGQTYSVPVVSSSSSGGGFSGGGGSSGGGGASGSW